MKPLQNQKMLNYKPNGCSKLSKIDEKIINHQCQKLIKVTLKVSCLLFIKICC